ncbi:hypothetical protein D3C71_1882030 [compost metagenome]
MSQKSKALTWFGLTLPDRNRSRLVYRFWRSCVPAIGSNGSTTIEPSPKSGEKLQCTPVRFSPFLGGGVRGRKGIVFKFKDMKR